MSQFLNIHPENPQSRLINQAVSMIRQGAVVVYPTDSGYALGCQLANKQAIERIIRIRQLDDKHNFTLLCRDLSELSIYARASNSTFRILKAHTPGPYTFILPATKDVPKRLLSPKRKTIGIRIPGHQITLAILEALGEPMMSTSLIMPQQQHTEADPEHIRDILSHAVDLILAGGALGEKPTSVIDLTQEDQATILRRGSGDVSAFE